MKDNNITLTLGQIAAGSIVGLISGWICLLVFENLIWQVLIGDRIRHGFWVGLLLLMSLSVWYGTVIIGASQGVRFVSQKFGVNIPLKPLCSGAFLGPPAVVGLLALLNVPWEIFGETESDSGVAASAAQSTRIHCFAPHAGMGVGRFAGRDLVYSRCAYRRDIRIQVSGD